MPLPSLVNGLVSAGSSGGAGIVPPILPATPRDTLIVRLFEDFGGGVDKTPLQNYAAWCLARTADVRSLHFGGRGYRFRHELIGDWRCRLTAPARGQSDRPTGYDPAVLIWEGDGSAFRTVKTRIRYRGGPEDPEDDPISACINIQVPGFVIDEEVTIELLASATNWDTLGFVGCRTEGRGPNVLRGKGGKANLWVDVTRLPPTSPELVGWDGRRYPSSKEHGADNFRLDSPSIWGALWGVVALGAQPKPGLESYGWDYTIYRRIVFSAVPVAGTTVRLGDITLTFTADPGGDLQLPVPASKAAAVTAIDLRLSELLATEESGAAYPIAYTAGYVPGADGESILCVRRDRAATDFDEQWTCSTNSPSIIDVGTGAPVTGPDPAPYWDGEKLVTDNRGAFGFSGVRIGPGYISSGPSGSDLTAQRYVDIRPDHNPLLEGWSGGCFRIDGLAGGGNRCFNHITMKGTNAYSIHPFCIRAGRVSNLVLDEVTTGRTGNMAVLDTNGVPLSVNHSSPKTAYYGPITDTPYTKNVMWYGALNAYYPEYFHPGRNGGQMLGSVTGPNILRQLNATQYLRAGSDPDDGAGDARGVLYLQMGRVSGYGAIVFEDGVNSWLAAMRYFRASGRLTKEIAGSQLVYETLTADGWVQTTVRPGGFSIRATDTGTGAGAELRAGANARVRLRVGTTIVAEFTPTKADFLGGLYIGGVRVINTERHYEDREYTRGILPTPTTANKGRAGVTNPESGKTPDVRCTGSAWVYLKDYTAVTIS